MTMEALIRYNFNGHGPVQIVFWFIDGFHSDVNKL